MADGEQESPDSRGFEEFVETFTAAGGRASFIVIPSRTHLGTLEQMSGANDPAMAAILQPDTQSK